MRRRVATRSRNRAMPLATSTMCRIRSSGVSASMRRIWARSTPSSARVAQGLREQPADRAGTRLRMAGRVGVTRGRACRVVSEPPPALPPEDDPWDSEALTWPDYTAPETPERRVPDGVAARVVGSGLMALYFLTEHEHAVVARCADRLLPPHGVFVGGGVGRGRRLRRSHPRRLRVRPAADLGGRPVLGSLRRRRRLRPVHPAVARRGTGVAHAHRGIARHRRTRVERAGARVAGDLPRRHRGARRRLPRPRRRASRTPRSTRLRSCKQLLFEHACEACYGAPEYGGNRDLAGWLAIEFPGDVQPRGYTDEEVSNA